MARRKTFRKRGRKQSSRRRRSLKGKGVSLGSMMPSFVKDPQKEYRHNLCCSRNYGPGGVCSPICDDSDAWYLRKIGPF